ncbi:hypothetical protein SNE40_004942 [Patella caerulea]|uniref:Uncharacterized protein n=1 Tax=Patella caerulea TaxID=87958 RepID=A0AAN8QD28_PATCE
MGCGSSTDTKKSQVSPKGGQKRNGVAKKAKSTKRTGFVGVSSLDCSDTDGDCLQPYRNNADTSQFANGIAYLYGFKARLKRQLVESTENGNLEKLEDSIAKYEKYEGPEDDDYFRALRRRHFLELQRGLRDGIRRRHAGVLDDAITNARDSQFSNKLKSHIAAAEKLRDHIWELEIHKHDVLDMDQKTVSEIKSYQRPPSCVFYTMKATYVLLGTEPDKIYEWGDIQILLNQTVRNGLLYKIDHFDLDEAKVEHAVEAEKILDNTDYEDVLKASNGVAIFYLWTNQNIEQIKKENKKDSKQRKKK